MLALFEIANAGTIEGFLVSIPESLGLLVFGLVLVATAVLIRKLMNRGESPKADDKAVRKA